jgi:hypothetical protein
VGVVLYCTTCLEAYGSAMYRVVGGANGIPSIFSLSDDASHVRCSTREMELFDGFAEY